MILLEYLPTIQLCWLLCVYKNDTWCADILFWFINEIAESRDTASEEQSWIFLVKEKRTTDIEI